MQKPRNFIKPTIKKPGALRKSLGAKERQKTPENKLEKAIHFKNPLTKR